MTENNQKQRILFVESGMGSGGSSMILYYMLKKINREKFEPIVAFYVFNNGPDTHKISSLGVPIYFLDDKKKAFFNSFIDYFSPGSDFKIWESLKRIIRFSLRILIMQIPQTFRLFKLIKRKDINLVVLNNDVHYHFPGVLAAKLSAIKCICRKAGGIGEGRELKRLLVPLVDLFVAISKATLDDQIMNNPSTKKAILIYEGVDLDRFPLIYNDSKVREEFCIPIEKKVICSISRFQEGKGQEDLIKAAALVTQEYSNVTFLIVGDEVGTTKSMKEYFKNLVCSMGIENHVIFTGWREDIPDILSSSDIFVHCPTKFIEGLCITNLEAMAMGKPTIVTENGGLPDAVIDGQTGFIVPPGDIIRLSESILMLLRDKDLVREFGKNARKRIEEKFDIEKETKNFELVLEQYVV